jgi:FtsP/CotA-like multicopper oxidase with cupredoxin domain
MRLVVAVPLLLTFFAAPRVSGPRFAERPMARVNNYERTAGVLRNGVLTVRLVAQHAQWRPADEHGVVLPADAFGEEGKPPNVPGPLIRAKIGTRVEASIRNALPETLVVSGLRERGPGSKESPVSIPPGATRPVAFTINAAGAYVYFGDLHASGAFTRNVSSWPGTHRCHRKSVDRPSDAAFVRQHSRRMSHFYWSLVATAEFATPAWRQATSGRRGGPRHG